MLAGDTCVGWRVEELLVITNLEMRLVAMTYKVKALNVRGRMIEDALGSEVVEPSLLGLEFKAHEAETLAGDQAHRWVSPKCLSGVS